MSSLAVTTVGSTEKIAPGTYHFGFVEPHGDNSSDHITFVNLRNDEGVLKDRFELSLHDFRDVEKSVVLLEGDTFEIVSNEIYFENIGDIYGYAQNATDRGFYFYLPHGYHEVSEDNEMLVPGTYSVEHMAEGGVISVGTIDSESGEFVPKSMHYSEMIVHLDNPIDLTLSAGEIIKIDRINHLAFNNLTYFESDEKPVDEVTPPDLGNGDSPEEEIDLNESPTEIIPTGEVEQETTSGSYIVGEDIAAGVYTVSNFDELGSNFIVWYENEYGYELTRYNEILGKGEHASSSMTIELFEGDRVSTSSIINLLFRAHNKEDTEYFKGEESVEAISIEYTTGREEIIEVRNDIDNIDSYEITNSEKENDEEFAVMKDFDSNTSDRLSNSEILPDTGVSQQNTTLLGAILAVVGLGFLVRRKKNA